jgi:hypothetical protein
MQFWFGLQYLSLVTFWDYWLATGISALWNIPAFSSMCICICCRRWNASFSHAMTLLSDLGPDVLLRPISSSCASRYLLFQYTVCNLNVRIFMIIQRTLCTTEGNKDLRIMRNRISHINYLYFFFSSPSVHTGIELNSWSLGASGPQGLEPNY